MLDAWNLWQYIFMFLIIFLVNHFLGSRIGFVYRKRSWKFWIKRTASRSASFRSRSWIVRLRNTYSWYVFSIHIYRNMKIKCSLTSFSVTRAVTLQFNFYHSDTINANEIEVEKQPTSSNTKVEPYHVNVKPGQGCDKSKMYVPTSMGRYNKRYCCLYCLKRYSKLVRHFTTVHKNEVEVKEFQALPLGKICLQYIYSKYSKWKLKCHHLTQKTKDDCTFNLISVECNMSEFEFTLIVTLTLAVKLWIRFQSLKVFFYFLESQRISTID